MALGESLLLFLKGVLVWPEARKPRVSEIRAVKGKIRTNVKYLLAQWASGRIAGPGAFALLLELGAGRGARRATAQPEGKFPGTRTRMGCTPFGTRSRHGKDWLLRSHSMNPRDVPQQFGLSLS